PWRARRQSDRARRCRAHSAQTTVSAAAAPPLAAPSPLIPDASTTTRSCTARHRRRVRQLASRMQPLGNTVVGMRQYFDGGAMISTNRAHNPNIEIADLLAQRVAVKAKHVCGLELVAMRGRQRGCDERLLDLAQHTVIESGRRQPVAEPGKILAQVL